MKTKKEMIAIICIVTFILSISFSLAENDLLITPEYIKISILPGEMKTGLITIENNGNKKVDLNLEISNKDDFMYIGDNDKETFVEIHPGQTKAVKITFSPSSDTEADLYINEVVYEGEGIKGMTLLVVSVKLLGPLLIDVNVEIQPEFQKVLAGNKVLGEITLINRDTVALLPVKLIYSIEDHRGNKIISREEDVLVETKVNFIREFIIPEYLKSGSYVFDARVVYEGYVDTSSRVFEVVEEEGVVEEVEEEIIEHEISEKMVIRALVIVFILFFITIYLYNRRLNKLVKQVGELETKHIIDEALRKK